MYELVLTMMLMYPGSNVSIQKTVLGYYETISQCEYARKHIDIRYNTSLECVKTVKKKV
jgi:hypothetical protein